MPFHVLVGTTEDGQHYLTDALRKKAPVTWVVPKRANVGDEVFLFIGKHFVGRAVVGSDAEPGTFRGRSAYHSTLSGVSLFSTPIPLSTIAEHVPDWGFLRQYSKTTHTPKPEIAVALRRLLISLIKGGRSDEDSREPSSGSTQSTLRFEVGKRYSREDVFDLLGIPPSERDGGDWFTGYHEHDGEFFVFTGVGTGGRTGHDYDNAWIGDRLRWRGKTGSRLSQPRIRRMVSGDHPVRIFWRSGDRDPFIYAGLGRAFEVKDTVPVTVVWAFDAETPSADELPPGTYVEGAAKAITVNAYERNPAARQACIARWGLACVACSFDFEATYGEHGQGFIHVHHLTPVSEIRKEYTVDPVADLRPVCPNCHSMIHRSDPPLTIEALRALLRR